MIFDSLANSRLYSDLHRDFTDCFSWLTSTPLGELAPGRHDIPGTTAFALVSAYSTKSAESAVIECHRAFIDIQVCINGEELVGYVPFDRCTAGPYDGSRDFQELKGALDYFALRPGLFALFYPSDGHQPGIMTDTTAKPVRKVVVKVPLEGKV